MGSPVAMAGETASDRLFMDLPVGAALVSADGRLLSVNRALETCLGYPPGGAPGRIETLAHREDTGALALQILRLLRREAGDYRAEHRLAHADGGALWAVVTAAAPADPQTPVIVQVLDIDRARRAEAALAHAEYRWATALDCTRQGVWDHDRGEGGPFHSSVLKALRGLPPDAVVPFSREAWLARVHPDDRERLLSYIDALEEGIVDLEEVEYRERHGDGHYVWFLSRGRTVAWDAEGNPLRTIGTDTDITRFKAAETALAEERERLRVTLHSIGDGVISTDGAGIIVFINPAAATLTGWSQKDAVGLHITKVFAIRRESEERDRADPVQSCLASGRTVGPVDDVVLLARGGVLRDIRCSASPIGARRERMGAVLVFQDISQSRALQRQLVHAASHDALTGLPNRAAFDQGLIAAVASARTGTGVHTLLYVDLDRFKPVNDTAGHAAGDELLRQVASTIRGCCRTHDLAARIGGDEFAVLLENCPLESARAVGAKIVRAIGALELLWAGRPHRIGASVGISVIGPTPASKLGALGEADAACYAAKAAGRGCVVCFTDIDGPPPAASLDHFIVSLKR